MIGRHRIGMLGQALLMLGAIPLPPPPKREVDLAAVQSVITDLHAAGLDSLAVADRAGPERFVELGRAVLAMQGAQRAQGSERTTEQLLDDVRDFIAEPRRDALRAGSGFEDALLPPRQLAEQRERDHMLGMKHSTVPMRRKPARKPKQKRDRSGQRAEQAKTRAAKSRKRSRKGWA